MRVKDQIIKDVIEGFNFHRTVLTNMYLRGRSALGVQSMTTVATALLYKVIDKDIGAIAEAEGLRASHTIKGLTLSFCLEEFTVSMNDFHPDLDRVIEDEQDD